MRIHGYTKQRRHWIRRTKRLNNNITVASVREFKIRRKKNRLKKQRLHEETEQSFENRALCVKRQREEKKKDKFGLVERER
jgi:hypothetical protein